VCRQLSCRRDLYHRRSVPNAVSWRNQTRTYFILEPRISGEEKSKARLGAIVALATPARDHLVVLVRERYVLGKVPEEFQQMSTMAFAQVSNQPQPSRPADNEPMMQNRIRQAA